MFDRLDQIRRRYDRTNRIPHDGEDRTDVIDLVFEDVPWLLDQVAALDERVNALTAKLTLATGERAQTTGVPKGRIGPIDA